MILKPSAVWASVFTVLAAATPSLPGKTSGDDDALATARIETVDRDHRIVQLWIKERNYLYLVSPRLTETRTHQLLSLDRLLPGERIRFLSRPSGDGQQEIVSLTILRARLLLEKTDGGGSGAIGASGAGASGSAGGGGPGFTPPPIRFPVEVTPFQ